MSPLLSYRPSLNAITKDKSNLLANDHIEIKNVLLEACRKYGSKGLNNEFLSLENKNIIVNITAFKSELISIEIFPELTIRALKERVCDIIGLPVQNQRFKYKGQMMEDSKAIKSYNLSAKSPTIELIPNFRGSSMLNIKIINEDVNQSVEASLDCKIKYLKKFVEFRLKIKARKQVFIYQGENLADESTLADYDLYNNAHVYLRVVKE